MSLWTWLLHRPCTDFPFSKTLFHCLFLGPFVRPKSHLYSRVNGPFPPVTPAGDTMIHIRKTYTVHFFKTQKQGIVSKRTTRGFPRLTKKIRPVMLRTGRYLLQRLTTSCGVTHATLTMHDPQPIEGLAVWINSRAITKVKRWLTQHPEYMNRPIFAPLPTDVLFISDLSRITR